VADDFLRLIPAAPTFMPPLTARQRAEARLRELLSRAEAVRSRATEHVEFVDQGGNVERVSCPECGADLGNWWPDAMDRAHAHHFADLAVTVPCCGAATSLNDLRYDWPAGFARFVLEALNPGVPDLPDTALAELEQRLGARLRVVRAHY
jgi:hypothetical protein